MRFRPSVLSLAISSLLFGHLTFADQSIEEVVITGNKMRGAFGEKSGIPLEKMPQSVQVIDQKEIASLGAVSIGDLLRQVPSANPGYSRVGAWQSFSLKVRGFLADQMRNGMRQRYYEDVDASAMSDIERVEVLKGPSGVLYGHSAVGGIVSIVTKRPQENFSASNSLTLGSDQQRVLAGDITGGLTDNISARLTGEFEDSDTFIDRQPMKRTNLGFSLTHQMGDNIQGNLVTEYIKRETKRYAGLPASVVLGDLIDLDISLDLAEPSFTDMQADAPLLQYWVDIKLNDNWSLTPRFQYQEFNTEFGEIRLRDPDANNPYLITRNGRWGEENDDYTIAQLDLNGEFNTGGLEHQILLGYERGWERGRFTQYNIAAGDVAVIDVRNPQYSYTNRQPVLNFAYDNFYDLDTKAIYIQDQITITEKLNVIAATRYSDYASNNGTWGESSLDEVPTDSTIWQIGGTYQFNSEWSLYAGFNTGFDIESTAGSRTKNGVPLDPEESQQTEMGLRFKQSNFSGSVSLFRIERMNVATSDPADPDFMINAGEQKADGIELEAEWSLNSHIQLLLGYAYIDGEITHSNDGDQGSRIGDLPEHNTKLDIRYQLNDNWNFRAGWNSISDRLLTNGSNYELDAYQLINAGIGYQQSDWSANLFLNNLLDEEYYSASGNRFVVIPGDPRSASFRLTKSW